MTEQKTRRTQKDSPAKNSPAKNTKGEKHHTAQSAFGAGNSKSKRSAKKPTSGLTILGLATEVLTRAKALREMIESNIPTSASRWLEEFRALREEARQEARGATEGIKAKIAKKGKKTVDGAFPTTVTRDHADTEVHAAVTPTGLSVASLSSDSGAYDAASEHHRAPHGHKAI